MKSLIQAPQVSTAEEIKYTDASNAVTVTFKLLPVDDDIWRQIV